MKALVTLFKPNGKYYTEEYWEVPKNAIGPYDMIQSSDFRRIDYGAVLVQTQEPWGYPHLFPGHEPRSLPIHRTEAGYPNCATCDGGGCYDCTDPA